jgi:hypothetical protein
MYLYFVRWAGSPTLRTTLVSRMLQGEPLVTAFVISGGASHQLLLFVAFESFDFIYEINRRFAAKCRDTASSSINGDVAIFTLTIRETEIALVHRDY